MKSMNKVSVVVPNWNGKESLASCLESLLAQTQPGNIIVVENGSTDGSAKFLEASYKDRITVLQQSKNLGFAGGVNVGIRYALENGSEFIALFNNDAVAEKNWLEELTKVLKTHPTVGISTCKLVEDNRDHFDSTGDFYTTWGLPYPRGRDEPLSNVYDDQTKVFAGSGGASLYRTTMLNEIGMFDADFFAYYEDVDVSFRAQLAGWGVLYVPSAVAFHAHGTTSSRIKGFTTQQTMKNLPQLLWKNVPFSLLPTVVPRFTLAYCSFLLSALLRGQGWFAIKGTVAALVLAPKTLIKRSRIQRSKKVSASHIRSILIADLPPNAAKLRKLRSYFIHSA